MVFTVTSAIEGETKRYGKFVCREYQDVFILWWKEEISLDVKLFAPNAEEEVGGFEIMDGRELIQKMREGWEKLVPRSTEYVDALQKAIGC